MAALVSSSLPAEGKEGREGRRTEGVTIRLLGTVRFKEGGMSEAGGVRRRRSAEAREDRSLVNTFPFSINEELKSSFPSRLAFFCIYYFAIRPLFNNKMNGYNLFFHTLPDLFDVVSKLRNCLTLILIRKILIKPFLKNC